MVRVSFSTRAEGIAEVFLEAVLDRDRETAAWIPLKLCMRHVRSDSIRCPEFRHYWWKRIQKSISVQSLDSLAQSVLVSARFRGTSSRFSSGVSGADSLFRARAALLSTLTLSDHLCLTISIPTQMLLFGRLDFVGNRCVSTLKVFSHSAVRGEGNLVGNTTSVFLLERFFLCFSWFWENISPKSMNNFRDDEKHSWNKKKRFCFVSNEKNTEPYQTVFLYPTKVRFLTVG